MSDALKAAIRANVPDFKFYKRVTDDPAFAQYFLDWLFDRFRRAAMPGAP